MEQEQLAQPFGTELVAGDTWSWTVSLSNYSPQVYTLKYFLRGPSTLDLLAVPDPSGTGFKLAATPTQTTALNPGTYAWQLCVFLSADRTELARGTVNVVGDLQAAEAGLDQRSFNRQMLDAIRAVMLGTASRKEAEYQINGRMLRLYDREKLMKLEGTYAWRVQNEQIKNGELASSHNQVRASFGDPSNPVLVRMWKNFPGSSA
jgi:hypothetical protein